MGLSQIDIQMLERTHRFNAKSNQGFSRQTRTDICLGLLGWTSIESLIDIKKLQFLGRLCRLSDQSLTARIFITRVYVHPG